MKVVIPVNRRSSNTSVPPETLTKEEKIVGPGGMIPTHPPEMVEMRGCLARTKEVTRQPLISRRRGNNLGSSDSRKFNKSSVT